MTFFTRALFHSHLGILGIPFLTRALFRAHLGNFDFCTRCFSTTFYDFYNFCGRAHFFVIFFSFFLTFFLIFHIFDWFLLHFCMSMVLPSGRCVSLCRVWLPRSIRPTMGPQTRAPHGPRGRFKPRSQFVPLVGAGNQNLIASPRTRTGRRGRGPTVTTKFMFSYFPYCHPIVIL